MAAFSLCFAALGKVQQGGKKGHVRSIFNERDLTGWVIMHGGEWSVEDRILIGQHGANWSTNPEKSGSWLRTDRPFADFFLELEYAINEGGNSGILFRSDLEKNPSFTGYEMQILADAGRPPSTHSSGSIYDLIAPSKNMSRPAGQWNQVRITAQGPHLEVVLNGEKIIDAEDRRSAAGYIGLQNHDDHAVVKFRHIRLKTL